jgi:hypothetical protein
MKTRFKGTGWIMAAIGIFCITSCATTQKGSGDKAEKRVDLGSYSVIVPPRQALETPGTGLWQVDIKKDKKWVRFWRDLHHPTKGDWLMRMTITVSENILGIKDSSLTLEQAAEEEQAREEKRMADEATQMGTHDLKDLKRGVTEIGGKKLHTLRFTRKWKNGPFEKSVLFYYFPPDFMEKDRYYGFLLSSYRQGGGIEFLQAPPYEWYAKHVIESLEIRP